MSMANCPRCGYHPATESKTGIPALEAEVRRLDDLIPRLQEEKAVILRRINDAQDITRRLTPEVLSNIFQFARPPIDFTAYEPKYLDLQDPNYPAQAGHIDPAEDFHHTLASVSHRWRKVALSTPQLWTSISLRVLTTFTNYDTSLLDLHFKYAQNLPLSIRLDLSNAAIMWTANEGSKRGAFLSRLDTLETTIFNQESDRIKSLVFIEPPVEWLTDDRSHNFSRCTSITVYWPCPRDDFDDALFDFRQLPNLQHVKVVDSGIQFELPPCLTALQLSEADLTHHMEAIAKLPNLVKFETIGTSTREIKSSVLPRLEHLIMKKMNVADNLGFLRFVRFARLTTLDWDEIKFAYRPAPLSAEGEKLRLGFFSSLPSTLSSLTFRGFEIDSPNLVELLGSIPQLAELHFMGSPQPVVIGAVEAIGRPPAKTGEASSSSTILPNLCALSISGTKPGAATSGNTTSGGTTSGGTKPGGTKPGGKKSGGNKSGGNKSGGNKTVATKPVATKSGMDASIFVKMLKTVHAAGPRPKQFLLNTHSDVVWPSDALQEVQSLLSSGLDAKVTFVSGKSKKSVPSG
ncbi:hypothetical protein Agabi119p4_9690 [Agaricus bisporus var. burnettii]|uniref:F-box domain-containing protein n=1 Tax=Agaricus bisporus var. burnettii TaxID=192524 RepID=A0A8H7C3V4_AGABI|nr:hypothetical protein Agabi119p4_9690 [Agaricus bisporus var. burnettii]